MLLSNHNIATINKIIKTMTKFYFPIIFAAMMICVGGRAQNVVEVSKTLNYRQPVSPQQMDNYLFSTYYSNEKTVYNLKGFKIASASGKVVSVKVNPAGASYALLSSNGKQWSLNIYDINTQYKRLYAFDKDINARAVCYSADSRLLFVANAAGVVHYYDTRGYTIVGEMALDFVPSDMVASRNGYFVAALGNNELIIVNQEQKTIRTRIPVTDPIKAVVFSDDSSFIGILSGNTINIYNTIDFKLETTIADLDGATSFSFHPDGKYVCVACRNNTLMFCNVFNVAERNSIIEPRGNVSKVKFINDSKHQVYISYNTDNAVCYKIVKGLKPNYTRQMREELNARMMEWCRRGENETDEQYNARVNEETKKRQKRIFANEISTSFAGDIISYTSVSLGRYNTATGSLELQLENMSSIYIDVPQNELSDFVDASNLEFCDVQYGITKNDTFEVIFAKVRNKANGKEYVFNNLEQQSLDFLATDDNFVSLELIQQANREDIVLQRIKKDIIEKAKNNQFISDHTNINVNTRIVSDINADGERINNYCVEFDYSVEAKYSAHEDFAPGKYRIEESHAAKSTLEIITKAFASDFAQYIVPGKKVIVSITGSADALPIVGTIAYDGCYGEFINEPYWLNANLSNITITSKEGIRTNEQLAFMRAQAVGAYLKANMSSLSAMQVEPRYSITVADGKGGEYRRIKVSFMFVDAMK